MHLSSLVLSDVCECHIGNDDDHSNDTATDTDYNDSNNDISCDKRE